VGVRDHQRPGQRGDLADGGGELRAVHLVGPAVHDEAPLIADDEPQRLVQLVVPSRVHTVGDFQPAHCAVNTPSVSSGTTGLASISVASRTSSGTPAATSSRPDTEAATSSGTRAPAAR
jgi:hypothetical protein